MWDALVRLANAKSVPERSVAGLFDASIGFRLRNAGYRSAVASAEGEAITEQTASRDLKAWSTPACTGLIASTFAKDITSPKVTVVFRDGEGKAVGGAYTFADFVPAGGQAAFTVNPLWTVPAGWTAEGYAEITSLSLLSS